MNPPELSQTEKQHLSELAEKTGDDDVRAAVEAYFERSPETAAPNGSPDFEPEWEHAEEADDGLDTACIQWCAEQLQGQPPPSLEEVRQELSTIKGSLAAEIIAERDES